MNIYMEQKRNQRAAVIREIVDIIVIIIAALGLAFCFVYFGFQITKVSGDSMSPTLQNNSAVLLSKSSYKFFSPKRYDVIKFTIKKSKKEHEYIKRIVALPKETICIKDGIIYVNNKKLDNLPFDELISSPGIADEEFTLDDDEYFVIGDNCNNSEDSRFANVGAVLKEDIDGKVIGQFDGIKLKKIK